VEIRPETIAVGRLANNVRQLFQPVAREGKLDFVIQVAPECPANIKTDVQRLEQVLKSLLSNAFKFTEPGRVSFSIHPTGDAQLA
jgi:signal transduction histidine kinase